MDPVAQYRANLERLQAGQPELVQLFENMVLTNLQLGVLPSGALGGTVFEPTTQAWAPLAHLQDPWAEAEADATALYNPEARVFVLLGLGLGYFALAFARRLQPHQRLAVFELDPLIFKAAMHANDLGPLLGGGPVEMVLGEGCAPALEQFFLRFPTPDKLYLTAPMRAGYTTVARAAAYEHLQAVCLDMLRYHGVGLATWQQFGAHIGTNDLDNLPEYLTLPGLNELEGLWEGRPAVCLAAGPSLAKNLAQLADPTVRAKVGVICAGPVYAVCRQLGICPDIVTAIDFQRLTYTDQFQHVPLDPRTSLVYLHSVHPEVPRRWPGPRFVARNSSDTTEWMKQFAEPKADAGQVQTVAHLNLVTAFTLGASPIVLLGQDLSQPQGAHHAHAARSRDTNVEESPDSHVAMTDIYGQPVWSRHSYLSMRTVFRQLIAGRPGAVVVNCTEGGLGIDGVPNRDLAGVLAECPPARSGPSLAARLAATARAYTPQTDWEKFWAGWRELREGAEALLGAAQAVEAPAAALPALDIPFAEAAAQADPAVITRVLALPLPTERSPAAFSSFVVRRFDLVVLLSERPPAELAAHPEWGAYFQARQTARLSAVLREEAPVMTQLLRRVEARLRDLSTGDPADAVPDWATSLGLLRRQSYGALEAWLRTDAWVSRSGSSRHDLLRALLAVMRGQYLEAMTMAPASAKGQAVARYAARRLEARESVRLSEIVPYLVAGPGTPGPSGPAGSGG